jgi:putative intracellular protease/amidase
VLFDAVCVIGGVASIQALKTVGETIAFVNEAAKHCKPILAVAEGVNFLADDDGCRLGHSVAKGGLRLADDKAQTFVVDQGVVTATKPGIKPSDKATETVKEAVKQALASMTGGPTHWAAATAEFIEILKFHRYWQRHVSSIPA